MVILRKIDLAASSLQFYDLKNIFTEGHIQKDASPTCFIKAVQKKLVCKAAIGVHDLQLY